MKSVTEFINHKLLKGMAAKTALEAEGKTEEEVQQSLSETFKLEGDKLKYFCNSMTVAADNQEKLLRVSVMSMTEGETLPEKAVIVEEHCYVPIFLKQPKPPSTGKDDKKNGPKKGKRKDGPKSSPWGISPEEQAAKKAAAQAAIKAKQQK